MKRRIKILGLGVGVVLLGMVSAFAEDPFRFGGNHESKKAVKPGMESSSQEEATVNPTAQEPLRSGQIRNPTPLNFNAEGGDSLFGIQY